MKITLMHPPLDDPTLPYHSSAYLKGNLVRNGFTDVSMRDINVEFVDYCVRQENVDSFYEEGERRLRDLERKATLSFEEQEEFYGLWATNRIEAGTVHQAAKDFRNKAAFLDFPRYLKNVNTLIRYFGFLGGLSYPAEIANFRHLTRARYSIYNLRDLFNDELGDRVCSPFLRYFEDQLRNDRELCDSDCFGISIVYDHQLFHALTFARALKRTWPDKMVLLGGTSISQLYKHLKDKNQLRHFFRWCDAIVVGEGETAICEIADTGGDLSKKTSIPNTITYDAVHDRVRLPEQIHYENVAELGVPIYEHPWQLYLAPERGINYAPTRGCYWNRCTFCDYGLNSDRPTSPWRERRIDQVISDLQHVGKTQGVKYVYFAVDVMAPGYLERLSDAIVDSGLDIRWSAELRMEKIFSAQRCVKMAESGCVCVSFGMESGNQRILDLIDKGTNVGFMAETMKNFAGAGIAVQLMAFTDFPTETEGERAETFKFIENNNAYWSTGGMGTFLLTGTSMIAKDPSKFGITVIETADADVTRALAYKVEAESERKVLLTEDCDASFDESGGAFPPVLGRPWAGGTDTLHSMIYYDTYERTFFRTHPLDQQPPDEELSTVELEDCTIHVPGKLSQSVYDISQIFSTRGIYKDRIKELLQTPIEPTYGRFHKWQSEMPDVRNTGEELTYWVTSGDRCIKLDKLVFRILQVASARHLTVKDVLTGFNDPLRARLLDYFAQLESSELVVFHDPGESWEKRRRVVRVDDKAVCRVVRVMPQGKLIDSSATTAGSAGQS
ncbi:MAG TPA: radical SAM protein [Blastocatellia bacterium]|nr:radical SAM protein [Blastocatellia bacterium]